MSEIVSLIKRDIKAFYYEKIKKKTKREIQLDRLKKLGMSIGKECYIFSDGIETAEPYLVTLGNHVTIAVDVKFATHDASANLYLKNVSDYDWGLLFYWDGKHYFTRSNNWK